MAKASEGHGVLISIIAFTSWGILPLYYQFLNDVNIWELLSHRLIWSVVLLQILFLLVGHRPRWRELWQDRKQLGLMVLAACLMTLSWSTFAWSSTHYQVLAVSLGYFMTPLFNIACAVVLLHERLPWQQRIAVLLAFGGLGYMLVAYGTLPGLSLLMGGSFALYGLVKKFVRHSCWTSLYVESVVMLPLAFVLLWFLHAEHEPQLFMLGDWTDRWLLILSAPMTLIPVMLFSLGVQRTSMSMIGFLQYIEPSLAFILAIFWFGEIPDPVRAVGFACVWVGLLVLILPLGWVQRVLGVGQHRL